MYGDAVFATPFRNQLAIFAMRVLIWLSRLLHAHIAYELDTDKIIAAFFRISNGDAVFAIPFRYQLAIFGVSCIDLAISTS